MSMLNDELTRIIEIGKATEELFKLTDTIEFGDRFDQEEGFECIARDTEELLEWYRKKKIR